MVTAPPKPQPAPPAGTPCHYDTIRAECRQHGGPSIEANPNIEWYPGEPRREPVPPGRYCDGCGGELVEDYYQLIRFDDLGCEINHDTPAICQDCADECDGHDDLGEYLAEGETCQVQRVEVWCLAREYPDGLTVSAHDHQANGHIYAGVPLRQMDDQTYHWCAGMGDDGEGEDCPHSCGGAADEGRCGLEGSHDCDGPGCPHFTGDCGCAELVRGKTLLAVGAEEAFRCHSCGSHPVAYQVSQYGRDDLPLLNPMRFICAACVHHTDSYYYDGADTHTLMELVFGLPHYGPQ